MFKFTQSILRQTKCNNNYGLCLLTRFNYYSASPTSVEFKTESNNSEVPETRRKTTNNTTQTAVVQSKNSIVAKAFASLNSDTITTGINTPFTDQRLHSADNVNDLLAVSEGVGVSRKHALKVVSILADWTTNGKVTLADFESDQRFIKLCRVLTKSNNHKSAYKNSVRNEDLSIIMNLTADDEAAKLVASISLPQMVKVMQTLAGKKRRSTALLRSLSYNITRSTEKLDLKQSGDLLYSMALLSFADENLLERIASDITETLEHSLKRSAVVGSIVTSLGLLRYKNTALMDLLTNWFIKNVNCVRPQDAFGLFLTLGVLNYKPSNIQELFTLYLPLLKVEDASRPTIWLDYIWSLILLDQPLTQQISDVLSPKFIDEVIDKESLSNQATKIKLLQINAATALLKDYNGIKLDDKSSIFDLNILRTKTKEDYATSVLETLKNLVTSDKYLSSNVNTRMGFVIDAEFVLDKKCHPVQLNDVEFDPTQHTRIALLTLDYHDMCRGKIEPIGTYDLARRLLEHKGYHVIFIPFSEFKTRDKLTQRVLYLESKLKAIIK